MTTVRGHVRNGRLLVDEPTELPEGTEVHLTAVHECSIDEAQPTDEPLSPEESRELQAIETRGKFVTHEALRAKLAARRG